MVIIIFAQLHLVALSLCPSSFLRTLFQGKKLTLQYFWYLGGEGGFASSHFCDLKNIILTLTKGFSGKNRP
jgi:hypothetical protein